MKKGYIGISDWCKIILAVSFGHSISFKLDRTVMLVVIAGLFITITLCEIFGKGRSGK